jgi:hypothetical protein
MKTLIKIGLLLLTYAVLLSSCKPEDFESSQSQVTLLTDGLVKNWQVTKVRRGTTEFRRVPACSTTTTVSTPMVSTYWTKEQPAAGLPTRNNWRETGA